MNPLSNVSTDRAGIENGITASPCRKCKHFGKFAPTECQLFPNCPLYVPPQQIFSRDRANCNRPQKPKQKKPPGKLHDCPFGDCDKRTSTDVCWRHRATYTRRLAMGMRPPDLFKGGHIRADHGDCPICGKKLKSTYVKTCSMECSLNNVGQYRRQRKLTDDQVREIRKSKKSYANLAREYGVSDKLITNCIKRETYKWVK